MINHFLKVSFTTFLTFKHGSISIFMKIKFCFPENYYSPIFWLFKHGFSYFLPWIGLWSTKFLMKTYAAVNGHLELPLLKDRQRFDAASTSNLEVYKFRDWWILTYFIFGHGESSLNNIWSMVNLERMCVLLFYYFLCLEANLDLEKTNQLGESSLNFIFAGLNLDPSILEKRWIDGESWPNNFFEKVNRGEDLRWVGSRCPLTRALVLIPRKLKLCMKTRLKGVLHPWPVLWLFMHFSHKLQHIGNK